MPNIIGGTFEDINEAVIQPVKDEIGLTLEQALQSVVPKQNSATQNANNNPQQASSDSAEAKQAETMVQMNEARRKIKYWKDLDEAQRRVREEEKQKQMQGQSLDAAQDRQVKQFEIIQKKKQLPDELAAKGKAEIKRGVGG